MNFLNVGPWELTVILILAILLVGPKRVVQFVQGVRRIAGQLRNMSGEFTSMIQTEIQSTEQGTDDVRQDIGQTGESLGAAIKEILTPIADVHAELQAAGQETRQALEKVVQDQAELATDVRAELEATVSETRQVLENVSEEGPPAQEEQHETSG